MKLIAAICVLLTASTVATPAMAANYFGTIDLVQKAGHDAMRFFIRSESLSLYDNSRDTRMMLLQAFFAHAKVSIGYEPVTCHGVGGRCGRVTFVTVDAPF